MNLMILVAASVLLPGDSHMSSGVNEAIIVFGSLLGVILAIVIWVVYFRQRPRRYRHRHHDSRGQTADPSTGELKRRRRVRRNQHPKRPQNPTLADTRGLPPVRLGNSQSDLLSLF